MDDKNLMVQNVNGQWRFMVMNDASNDEWLMVIVAHDDDGERFMDGHSWCPGLS